MRHLILPLLLVASTAAAQPPSETPPPPPASPRPEAAFGIAINNPLMWNDGDNVAGSVYVRFATKHVVRVNVARYHYAGPVADNVVNLVHHGFNDDDSVDHSGYISDISVGWSYYPRRAFDGPNIELAALWRESDTAVRRGEVDTYERTTEEGVRALVGWSWLYRDRGFASVAVGASTGYAVGNEAMGPDTSRGPRVAEWTAGLEGYLRFGFVFGN